MEIKGNKNVIWSACPICNGHGKRRKELRKKVQLWYERAVEQFEKTGGNGIAPILPIGSLVVCENCNGSGLVVAKKTSLVNKEKYPHIAIIGGGIGGVALAVACLHRSIPFTLYERDVSFDARSQGYGLTLQQAARAIKGLGIVSLEKGVRSTRHLMHTSEGKVIGEWGMRKWDKSEQPKSSKPTNVHIARQSLRLALLEQLGGEDKVQWGHQLLNFKESESESVDLNFQVDGEIKTVKTDLVVGADGIRSTLRKQLIGEDITPLQYLGCIVILGICKLEDIKNVNSDLLDAATVFQTANGNERIYMMPYEADSVMWQLSFPMSEEEAMVLSVKGAKALKEESCRRTQWHNPIPQILLATNESLISGYPVYDRELLKPEFLEKGKNITLIGDAAHPMSPFKGQGANQALLDALELARRISKVAEFSSGWKEVGVLESILKGFELEMMERSASKVKRSAIAVKHLHSEEILKPADGPRGRVR